MDLQKELVLKNIVIDMLLKDIEIILYYYSKQALIPREYIGFDIDEHKTRCFKEAEKTLPSNI